MTTFQKSWLKEPEFVSWLAEVEADPHSARCTTCKKTFSLSNMGHRALTSHCDGKKHKENSAESHNPIMTAFIKRIDTQKSKVCGVQIEEGAVALQSPPAEAQTAQSGSMTSPIETQRKTKMDKYMIDKQTQVAEILWAINCVVNHFSANSTQNTSKLFERMFKDSQIAAQYSMGKQKFAYLISYGVAHGFRETLVDTVREKDVYSVLFDEAFNHILQEDQMDIHVRFWLADIVTSSYYNSQFLGHTKAEDLLDALSKALSYFDKGKLFQIGMDSPNVNLKLLELYKKERKDKNEDFPDIIDIGVCSLHVVHGGLQTGYYAHFALLLCSCGH